MVLRRRCAHPPPARPARSTRSPPTRPARPLARAGHLQDFPEESEWAPSAELLNRTLWRRYIDCLSWSVSSLVGKGLDTSPKLIPEQLFSMVVTLLGLLLYAVIIGNMASILSAFDRQATDVRKQLRAARDFLRKKGIRADSSLGDRILQYFEFTLRDGEGGDKSDAVVTRQLPNSLLSEVILHENYALIHKVHLFNGVSQGFVNSLVLKIPTSSTARSCRGRAPPRT